MNILVNGLGKNSGVMPVMNSLNQEEEVKGNGLVNDFTSMAVNHGFTSTKVAGGVMMSEGEDFANTLKEKAAFAKDNAKALLNKLSISDVKKADKEGLGIKDEDVDKVINVVEDIKIMLATYCEDYVPVGGIDLEDVKAVSGSAALAAKVIKKLSQINMPLTKDNVYKVSEAVGEYEKTGEVSESGKRYLLSKGLEVNTHNMYEASLIREDFELMSMNKARNPITDAEFEQLMPEIGKIVSDEQDISNARMILEEGGELNEDSLLRARKIDQYDYSLGEDEIIDREARALLGSVDNYSRDIIVRASINEIVDIVNNNKTLSINNLASSKSLEADYIDDNEPRYQESYSILIQAKFYLGAGSLGMMEKLGIDVENAPLHELTALAFDGELGGSVLTEGIRGELLDTPLSALETFAMNSRISVEEVIGAGERIKYECEVAFARYETMQTEIRNDLGDSFLKAVKNSAGDILDDLGLEDNDYNRAAVKILSYGQLEINKDMVLKTASDYKNVVDIIAGLNPEYVLKSIRNGKDILKMDIGDLATDLMDYEEVESFDKFLYKLDKKGKISADERKEYIRVYKAIDRMRKDDVKSLGDVLRNGEPITGENILRAYVSRKDSGIDFIAGENSEVEIIRKDYSYVSSILSEELTDDYYNEEYERIDRALMAEDEVVRSLTDSYIPVSINNLYASMIVKERGFFTDLRRKALDLGEDIKDELEDIYSKLDENDRDDCYDEVIKRVSPLGLNDYVRGLGIIKEYRGREYQIPMVRDDDIVNVNLKVVGGDDKGSLLIKMDESFGRVSLSARVRADKVDAFVTADNREMVELINGRKDAIIDRLIEMGFGAADINITYADSMVDILGDYSENGDVDTLKLYSVAKLFIGQMLP